MKKRGRYPKAFKVEAVRLLREGGKPAAELALQLDVKRTLLYRWRDQVENKGDEAFLRNSGPRKKADIDEVNRLKKQLKEVTEERDILKKAAAYFAKDLK